MKALEQVSAAPIPEVLKSSDNVGKSGYAKVWNDFSLDSQRVVRIGMRSPVLKIGALLQDFLLWLSLALPPYLRSHDESWWLLRFS